MIIRLLTETDASAFRAIRLRALREEPTAFTSSYEEFSQRPLDKIAARFRSDPTEEFMLGAFDDDRLVGIVGYYRDGAKKQRHRGNIISMYVTPEVRGRGVGKALLLNAIERVREIPGVDQLLLGVMVSQHAAQQLYATVGFVVFGREPRALKVGDQYYDEEFMILDLRRERS
ncbi:MAG: GNAT family N-acetyltransferase [Anaerolineae bacterium]